MQGSCYAEDKTTPNLHLRYHSFVEKHTVVISGCYDCQRSWGGRIRQKSENLGLKVTPCPANTNRKKKRRKKKSCDNPTKNARNGFEIKVSQCSGSLLQTCISLPIAHIQSRAAKKSAWKDTSHLERHSDSLHSEIIPRLQSL